MTVDIAVIGGGPAGAAAAIACARAGMNTVLFERRPTEKTVGADAVESVGPDVTAFLVQMGTSEAVAGTPFPGVMHGQTLSAFGGKLPIAGAHLQRQRFDQLLREAASRAGAKCHEGTPIHRVERRSGGFLLAGPRGTCTARIVIDGSGRRRCLARNFSLPWRRLSPPLIAWRRIINSERTGAFATFAPLPDGWLWQADISLGRALIIRLCQAGAPTASGAAPYVATWQLVSRLAAEDWFLAGDAAGAFDPASGNGIELALRSGWMAGRAAADAGTLTAVIYHDAQTSARRHVQASLTRLYDELGIGVLRSQLRRTARVIQ